jgi:hypothetical protein
LSAAQQMHRLTCGTVCSQPAPRLQYQCRTSPSAKSSATTPTDRTQMDMHLGPKKVSAAGAPTKETRCPADNEHTWIPRGNDESERSFQPHMCLTNHAEPSTQVFTPSGKCFLMPRSTTQRLRFLTKPCSISAISNHSRRQKTALLGKMSRQRPTACSQSEIHMYVCNQECRMRFN